MKKLTNNRYIVLATFVIVAILTACPATDKGGAGSGNADNGGGSDPVSRPSFQNLGIDVAKKKIIVFFNTEISGTPDASKISLKKGSANLTPTTDYTLAIEKGKLVIILTVAPKESEQYTVELQGGAVKNAKGKDSTANTSSDKKTLTVGSIPAITEGSLAFQANSNTVLTLAFNTNIEIVDKAKIKVEVQAGGTGGFTAARATSMVDTTTTTQLNLTLGTAATHGNVYRVTVGAGALKATESNLVNAGALSSSQTTYSTRPILRADPYILDNKLVAPFNISIELRDPTKVKVYKNPAGGNEEINLNQGDIAVNSKNLLEITLPAVTAGEVYRVRLAARAINEDGKAANTNEAIAPADITIGAAPALHTETAPFLGRQNIVVTFDAPIRILDKTRIKYQLNGTLTTPDTDPTVVNTNQLEIPLNDPLEDGHVYRIHLEPGALGGGKNTVSMGAIQPEDKDITVWLPDFKAVKPAFDSATQLSVTFLVDVALMDDGSTINVQKKDDGSSFTTLTAASRDIAVDDMEAKKINITLTGSEKITPYTQVWKVEFPTNTVKTAISQIPNAGPLTTLESEKPKLTDLYSWEEVTKASGSNKWKARSEHTSVMFNSKIWVLGGDDGNTRNDVWSSPDGKTWTQVNAAADWKARSEHTSVVFKGKIWVLGGYDGTNPLNDVWSSPDGSTWTESMPPSSARKITAGTGKNWWTARAAHTSVVFAPAGAGKKIWVLGGNNYTNPLNDVWSSTDGSNWTESTPPKNAEKDTTGADANWWKSRFYFDSAVFQNKIWITGGSYYKGLSPTIELSDLWSSSDGQTWTKGNDLDRTLGENSMVAFEGRLWLLGGKSAGSEINRIWSSALPADSWVEEKTLLSGRRRHSTVVFDDRIWVMGGRFESSSNNVDNRVFVLKPNSP